jgi:transposase
LGADNDSHTTALMTISEVDGEVLSEPERRRRWSVEQKLEMVAEMMRPGASASRVARRHRITTGLLYTWRRQAVKGELSLAPVAATASAFVPIHVTDEGASVSAKPSENDGAMVIELGGDRRVRVGRDVDAEALRRVIDVLCRR